MWGYITDTEASEYVFRFCETQFAHVHDLISEHLEFVTRLAIRTGTASFRLGRFCEVASYDRVSAASYAVAQSVVLKSFNQEALIIRLH